MTLIRMQDLALSVGGPHPLLEEVQLHVGENERVGVVGRNGAGKSTLLRLLAGEIEPDEGTVERRRGLQVARLAQQVPVGTRGRVFDVVARAVGPVGEQLAAFHRASREAAASRAALGEMARLQQALDAQGGWDAERRVTETLSRLDLPQEADFTALSGGMQRRVLLAQALAADPELLLLDEPTNHLDLENIAWLEGFLAGFGGTLVFVTHDRRFLRTLATRILEIDRGHVASWPGDYEAYLRRRRERLHAEAQEHERLEARLAQEELWIRQGIKARRTRNMGRVRQLEALREASAGRRPQEGRIRLQAPEAERSGKKVIEAHRVGFAWNAKPVVRDLTTTIQRGERVGILGRNGSGKSTLLRLLLGELEPQEGTVQLGTRLDVARFDQQRAQLDEDANLIENLTGGREYVDLGQGRRKHALAYLRDFLFPPERARAPIRELSGGERSRLLLARLFSRPTNLLVMDEPTNDLDLETLELLEERVAAYAGTLLLVSHDRDFLDHIVTRLLVLEGDGRVELEAGNYSAWRARRDARHGRAGGREPGCEAVGRAGGAPPSQASAPAARRRGLGYKEKRELASLPERIEALEAQLAELSQQLADPSTYKAAGAQGEPARLEARLHTTQHELDAAYRRWEELEARRAG